MNLIRPAVYAAGAIAGVAIVNELRPVDAAGAAAAGLGGLDASDLVADIFAGRFGEAKASALGAGGAVAAGIRGQIRTNVVIGVVGGCVVAAFVDALLL